MQIKENFLNGWHELKWTFPYYQFFLNSTETPNTALDFGGRTGHVHIGGGGTLIGSWNSETLCGFAEWKNRRVAAVGNGV